MLKLDRTPESVLIIRVSLLQSVLIIEVSLLQSVLIIEVSLLQCPDYRGFLTALIIEVSLLQSYKGVLISKYPD